MTYYLPIGTVVLLKGATKRIMITGYQTFDADVPDKVWDYSAVLYPEGSLSSDQILLFDHFQIGRIFFEGYKDEEYFSFLEKLNSVIADQASSMGC